MSRQPKASLHRTGSYELWLGPQDECGESPREVNRKRWPVPEANFSRDLAKEGGRGTAIATAKALSGMFQLLPGV